MMKMLLMMFSHPFVVTVTHIWVFPAFLELKHM